MNHTVRERVIGCLKGIATGDAIGKQTETLTRDGVVRWYPNGVRGFEGAPGSIIPRYVGNEKREWRVGETTDDTERTIAVARAILQDRGVVRTTVGRELLKCTKSVHPGVTSYWEFHQAGDPARIAQTHDGCGAAIRVAPVGVVYSSDKLERIVAGARDASIPTHGGPLAIAAAAATAAGVSAAIDGASPGDVADLAQRAASQTEGLGSSPEAAAFATAVRDIHDDLRQWSELGPGQVAERYYPDSPWTIVPLALALGTIMESAEEAILLSTNVGGDSDSVASIAGAILGATDPASVNADWYAVVEEVNRHDLVSLADDLAAVRC